MVVVVGGGLVGRRKAGVGLNAGASVRLIAPEPQPDDFRFDRLEWCAAEYRPGLLAGAALVFAAATAEVNARVVADAKRLGVWANSATDPDSGDFTLPAVGRVGGVTLAVGTGGVAPALARRLRDRLVREVDERIGEWLELLDELRPETLAAVPDEAARRSLLDGFADWPWLERLKRDGRDATLAAMRAEVGRAGDGSESPGWGDGSLTQD